MYTYISNPWNTPHPQYTPDQRYTETHVIQRPMLYTRPTIYVHQTQSIHQTHSKQQTHGIHRPKVYTPAIAVIDSVRTVHVSFLVIVPDRFTIKLTTSPLIPSILVSTNLTNGAVWKIEMLAVTEMFITHLIKNY